MKRITSLKAIRLKCLDCSNGSSNEVKLCPVADCPLHEFRLGKNPYTRRKGNIANLKAFKKAPVEKQGVRTQRIDFKEPSSSVQEA